MTTYNGISLPTETGEVVLLKFIESMHFRKGEDATVDKLKGDLTLSIRTISGKEYVVSLTTVQRHDMGPDIVSLAEAIFEKWTWIHKP
jgi:hypothetical protein